MEQTKPTKPKGKRGGVTRTSWKPGCPSPNPGGRPRRALAMAEKVREIVDPAEWVAFELAIARDEKQPLEARRASWLALVDRGFVKAPTTIDVTTGQRDELNFDALPLDVARAELARLEALASGTKPDGTPGEPAQLAEATPASLPPVAHEEPCA